MTFGKNLQLPVCVCVCVCVTTSFASCIHVEFLLTTHTHAHAHTHTHTESTRHTSPEVSDLDRRDTIVRSSWLSHGDREAALVARRRATTRLSARRDSDEVTNEGKGLRAWHGAGSSVYCILYMYICSLLLGNPNLKNSYLVAQVVKVIRR